MSHHEIIGGQMPQAPSAIARGNVPRFRKPFDTPEAMTLEDTRSDRSIRTRREKCDRSWI